MEEIHGVTFRDYACASANIVGGMGLDKVCQVLGLEEPVWGEVQEFWNNKMAELSMDDMAFYGEVFTNPKQGKFANVEGAVGGVDDVLAKYPEWSDYIKMEMYSSAANEVGIDIDFDKEFGVSITQYSQLGGHWSAYFKEKVMDVQGQSSEEYINDAELSEAQKEASRVFELHGQLRDKWEEHYKEKYKDQGADISSDIEF